jgi:bacillithiol system protein YtxJ
MTEILDLDQQTLPPDCYVFKHSTQCATSARAAAVVRGADLDLPVFWLKVIEQRGLSDRVAQELGVPHESPQLIEIRGGAVRRVLNHYDVSRTNLAAR